MEKHALNLLTAGSTVLVAQRQDLAHAARSKGMVRAHTCKGTVPDWREDVAWDMLDIQQNSAAAVPDHHVQGLVQGPEGKA